MGRHEVGGKWVRGVVEGRTWRDMSGVRGHPQWEEPALDPPQCGDPGVAVQVYVAAFAVSAYASTFYRAGSKPFNPVLGETYECVRPDRGFRFISEQVLRGWGGRERRGGARGAATPPLSSPRSAITPPSPLATPSPTTSSSGKVGAGLRGPRMGSQSGPDPHLPPSPRHEVEEQILGQILGDRPGGHRQRPPAQVSTHPPLTPPPPSPLLTAPPTRAGCRQVWGPLRVEQSDHVHPQRAQRPALDRALRRGADPQHARRLVPLQDHLLQGAPRPPRGHAPIRSGSAHAALFYVVFVVWPRPL